MKLAIDPSEQYEFPSQHAQSKTDFKIYGSFNNNPKIPVVVKAIGRVRRMSVLYTRPD